MKPNLGGSKYFIKTFKDFYSIKSKYVITPLNLNSDTLYLYDNKLFDSKFLKDVVYKNYINNTLLKPKKLKIKYIDFNINSESDLYLYNFVREYVKIFNKFKDYKKSNKDYSLDTLFHTVKHKRRMNKAYKKYKKQYLEYRTTFKIIFKDNPKLGQYYMYLANCGITEDNINIKEYSELF